MADEQLTALAEGGYDRTHPGTVVWPLTDHQGTVRDLAVRDAQTGVTSIANHRAYDAYGDLKSQTNAAVDCLFAFTGRPFDKRIGLQNNLNRWYDAKIGGWVSHDPLGMTKCEVNTVSYCHNSPTNHVDPSGLGFLSDYWYYLWNPSKMDADLRVAHTVSIVMIGVGVAGLLGIFMGTVLAEGLVMYGLSCEAGAFFGTIFGSWYACGVGYAIGSYDSQQTAEITGFLAGLVGGNIRSPVCFVAGTPVLVSGDMDQELIVMTKVNSTEQSHRGVLLASGVLIAGIGLAGFNSERRDRRRKQKHEEEFQDLIDQLFGDIDLLNENYDSPLFSNYSDMRNGCVDSLSTIGCADGLCQNDENYGYRESIIVKCPRVNAGHQHQRGTTLNVSIATDPSVESLTTKIQMNATQTTENTSKPIVSGRWFVTALLFLFLLLFFGTMFSSPNAPACKESIVTHSPASKAIEHIRVGERVVAQNGNDQPGTAVDPATWKKLVLRADWRWQDGTRDDVNVETLVPPSYLKEHSLRVGSTAPLPVDLTEMGLPDDLDAIVLSIEPCPPIKSGRGRVVLTTVNHLNPDVVELSVRDGAGRVEKIRPTYLHRFYSDTRDGWVVAGELRDGERLRGVSGPLNVCGVAPFPGVHRVYNMTVENEHVYRVASSGVLVHNTCETLYRFGTSKESMTRLARKAAEAEEKIGIHGVSASTTAAEDASMASRSALEKEFTVHNTPTASDLGHKTIELPKPVTKAITDVFNAIFGR